MAEPDSTGFWDGVRNHQAKNILKSMQVCFSFHRRVEVRQNPRSISLRCHLFEVAFVWELTIQPIHLPLGCLQGGSFPACKAF